MKNKVQIDHCWITINKTCNLSCGWCYLKEDKGKWEDMDLEDAKKIIDMISQMNISSISIIGGEPVCHKDLVSIIEYCSTKKLHTCLNTNGLLLQDYEFINQLCKAGLKAINFSLKGYNEQDYFRVAGRAGYQEALTSLQNISHFPIQLIVSFVLTIENVDHLLITVHQLMEKGCRFFYFSMNYDFKDLKNRETCYRILSKFITIYTDLDNITKGCFVFHPILPLCVLDEEFVRRLLRKSQLVNRCHIMDCSGIVFDNHMNLIPCNALFDVILGEYNIDFFDTATLESFYRRDDIKSFYNKITGVPHERCLNCEFYYDCMGGCIMQWLFYDFDTLFKRRDETIT